jgi:hypothetical protein
MDSAASFDTAKRIQTTPITVAISSADVEVAMPHLFTRNATSEPREKNATLK